MKKFILTLAVVISSCAYLPCLAAETEVIETEQATTVEASDAKDVPIIKKGKTETVIIYKGATDTISTEEYNDQKYVRKLSDLKIAKNVRVNKADSAGMGVTVMSMCIVLLALIALSLLFMLFGKIFARKQTQKKKEAQGIADDADHVDDHDSGEVIAAIALALDEHFNSKHDIEDAVLTIRRMKRAYSPWNSKIYNMRELPSKR